MIDNMLVKSSYNITSMFFAYGYTIKYALRRFPEPRGDEGRNGIMAPHFECTFQNPAPLPSKEACVAISSRRLWACSASSHRQALFVVAATKRGAAIGRAISVGTRLRR